MEIEIYSFIWLTLCEMGARIDSCYCAVGTLNNTLSLAEPGRARYSRRERTIAPSPSISMGGEQRGEGDF